MWVYSLIHFSIASILHSLFGVFTLGDNKETSSDSSSFRELSSEKQEKQLLSEGTKQRRKMYKGENSAQQTKPDIWDCLIIPAAGLYQSFQTK